MAIVTRNSAAPLALVAIILALSAADHAVNASRALPPQPAGGINQFCKNPKYRNQQLCSEVVNGAKTWEEAMSACVRKSVEVTSQGATTVINAFTLEGADSELRPSEQRAFLDSCKGHFEQAVFALNLTQKYIPSGSPAALKTIKDLFSNIQTNLLDKCRTEAEKINLTVPLTLGDVREQINQPIRVCLYLASHLPNTGLKLQIGV